MPIQPFHIDIPEPALADLQARLAGARWPSSIFASGWEDGTQVEFLQSLVRYWQSGFQWREQERRLNRLPQFKARLGDADIHFVHKKGNGPKPLPLILTHGWPGSFAEFESLIPLLTEPQAHGASADDAFDVVVPSLPGFGFSSAPREPGCSARHVADLWTALMRELGYARFGAQGGDIGAAVSLWLARQHPNDLLGIHVNYIPGSFRPGIGQGDAPVSAEEQAYLDRVAAFAGNEGAYNLLQSTKPQTLAFSLSDSPVGLAAWISEKFVSWSDCDGRLENALSLDTLLTDIAIYWFGNTVASSLRMYKENRREPLTFAVGERINVPVGVAIFPRELPMPPRSWVERVCRVERWTPMPRGGHFAALEQAKLLAQDIRDFFRPLRGA